jgi:hypothetical protein
MAQLEKAFAINAAPDAVWRALTGELEVADASAFAMERAVPNELLSLWVQLQGGVRALITYRLIPRGDHTEVVATMHPEGFRYAVARIITLGRVDTNYELVLAQGLANLKSSVEGDSTGLR